MRLFRAPFSLFTLIVFLLPAYSQPVGEFLQEDLPSKSEPRLEFYNWLYGSSRRNWFEWHTVTAAINSTLSETGFRARSMGGIGGYVSRIKGNEAENAFAAANDLEDNFLPLLDQIGELHGMNAFGGLQFGYTFASDNWKISGFVGASVVRTWALASHLSSGAFRLSADAETLNGTRYGVLVSLEGELHPTEELMISTWSTYTPAYRWGYFEVKSGIAVPFREKLALTKNAYIGPHLALNISEGDKQPMLGAHISGVTIAGIYLCFSAGYTREPSAGSGLYSILETSFEF